MAKVEKIVKTSIKLELTEEETKLLIQLLEQHPQALDSVEDEEEYIKKFRTGLIEECQKAIE